MTTLPNRVLVVDDEHRQVAILRAILEREGFEVDTADTAESALAILRESPPDAVLTDLKLPGKDGIDLLREAGSLSPPVSLLIMTAHGTIDSAVEAIKLGAFDYLTKPLERERLVLTVRRALEKTRLLRENLDLRQQFRERYSLPRIIGDHGKMQDVFRLVLKVGPSNSTVLICGESGSGKELIARAVHSHSRRSDRPFYAINCAALPEPLLESELFGHEKGAFTGAVARKIGLFEEASGSTLFLDEVGDMGTATQAKVLRSLQEREIRRVGGNQSIPVDVRIVAATNQDLSRLMREGKFREDLYYRLNVVVIPLPSLRERKTDIPLLVNHFLARHTAAAGKEIRGIEDRALAALMRYDWPGNVRQCESVMERAVLLAEGSRITWEDLPQEVRQEAVLTEPPFELPDSGISFESLEKSLLDQALRKGGNVSRAARLLGLTRRTLQYRLQKFGLREAAPKGAPPARKGMAIPVENL